MATPTIQNPIRISKMGLLFLAVSMLISVIVGFWKQRQYSSRSQLDMASTKTFVVTLPEGQPKLEYEQPKHKVNQVLDNTNSTTPTSTMHQLVHHQTHAVVHMGIHKTGSTSIQFISREKKELLKLDGYEMPWIANQERNTREENETTAMVLPCGRRLYENQVNFATCFIPPSIQARAIYPCDPDLLLYGLDIAARNRNLFVTAETFAKIDSEGVNRLAQYLSHWDETTIVIFYRHYYDWIASLYNEQAKKRKFEDTNKWESSVLDSAINFTENTSIMYISMLIARLKDTFRNIVVINFHGKNSPHQSLFCHPALNMIHTCDAIRAENVKIHMNKAFNIDYDDLAYGASKAGLVKIETEERMYQVSGALQLYHENALNSSAFKRVCLPQDIQEKLWNYTLVYQAMFFPDEVDSIISDLRSDFEKVTNEKLCKLDVESILEEGHWRDFFQNVFNKL